MATVSVPCFRQVIRAGIFPMRGRLTCCKASGSQQNSLQLGAVAGANRAKFANSFAHSSWMVTVRLELVDSVSC